jgi:hypothetical protein
MPGIRQNLLKNLKRDAVSNLINLGSEFYLDLPIPSPHHLNIVPLTKPPYGGYPKERHKHTYRNPAPSQLPF